MKKVRLDIWMVEKGLSESRNQAQRLIMAGKVRIDNQVASKPSDLVIENAQITVDLGPKFVSRGGEKLEAAILGFGLVDLHGKICVDVGASTGGFTDCLLQYGAQRVYAVDVGYGVLHWKIRSDTRVVVMEKTNARFVEQFPEKPDLVTVDASFISLKILLPVIQQWFQKSEGRIICLIKPQFEAGRLEVDRGEGVIQDPEVHHRVLEDVIQFARGLGLGLGGLLRSPLKGPKGNSEFLALFYVASGHDQDPAGLIRKVINEPDTGFSTSE